MHAVGSAVTNVAEGDKVIVHPLITCGLCRACRSGDDVHCENSQFPGIDTNGGYAEYLQTSARSVVSIDDSLEPADVAALADAGLTAYHAAAKAARRLTPRDRVRGHRRRRPGPHRHPGAQGAQRRPSSSSSTATPTR